MTTNATKVRDQIVAQLSFPDEFTKKDLPHVTTDQFLKNLKVDGMTDTEVQEAVSELYSSNKISRVGDGLDAQSQLNENFLD